MVEQMNSETKPISASVHYSSGAHGRTPTEFANAGEFLEWLKAQEQVIVWWDGKILDLEIYDDYRE